MSKSLNLNVSLVIAVIIIVLSCKQNGDTTTSATIIDEGLPAADGCGWMMRIDNDLYSPTNLPDQYKKNNKKVDITYKTLLGEYQCGIAANLKYPRIEIKTIQNEQDK
ncbi:MAG: hypothetical protein JWR50_1419 [Mucilaginibacter sp.]|nr:hypothetical protein [Mucilaginibacter sp.]